MRIIVTGSRNWSDQQVVYETLDKYINDHAEWEFDASGLPTGYDLRSTVIVHGKCPTGADAMAEQWAKNKWVRTEHFNADWKTHGRAAGPIRNKEMVESGADVCIAFIKGNSKGATGCAKLAEKAGIPVIYRRDW
jgi:hypothetical protein